MTQANQALRLHILDDEIDICRYVSSVAEQLGFIANYDVSPARFIEHYPADIDVLVLDLYMPDIDGIELLRFLVDNTHTPPRYLILISGGDEVVLKSAQRLAEELGLNILSVLSKPVRKHVLEAELNKALQLGESTVPLRNSNSTPTLAELKTAIAEGHIDVAFQPQVLCCNQKVVAVEALARWDNPRVGAVEPLTFVTMAEQEGLIAELDHLMMRKAISWLSLFQRYDENLRLSLNMSAHTVSDLSLPELVLGQLEKYAVTPESLSIEVTETALMRDLIKSLDNLTRLRMKGIQLSIDDFGTGYSSMLQLVRIPFSELKIDGSFVEGGVHDRECKAVVNASVMLAKELGMSVVAEKVSNADVLSLAKDLGCDLAQGYFTGRPIPPEDVIQLLKKQLRDHAE